MSGKGFARVVVLFFFQAEDGIRDLTVTGVQTCALPILPDRLGELDGHHEIVTHCHHGARSLKALEILKAAGFSKVRSLRGGIDAWAVRSEERRVGKECRSRWSPYH